MSSGDSKGSNTGAWIGAGATILAAIIAAVVAVVASRGGSSTSSGGGPPTATSPASVPASTPATSSAIASPPASAASVALVWHHRVRFPAETGLDLRDSQPNIVGITDIPDFETGAYSPGFTPDGARAAGTVAKSDPAFSDCTDSFISQSQTSSFDVPVGQTACFQSRDGTRVAAVTVLSYDRQTYAMDADVTVWQAPASG